MNTHANQTQENKSQSVANEISKKQSGGESTFRFVDNRPEAVAQRKLQEMANNSPRVTQLKAFQDMANIGSGVMQLKKTETDSKKPQAFFLAQPHGGELAAFCGYYALSNYRGEELDLDAFRQNVYAQYTAMSLPENEIPQLVSEMGTGMEGIAVKTYNFTESGEAMPGIEHGRFMAATNRYGGHWLTYIRDGANTWWEYDSWKSAPSLVGSAEKLQEQLATDGMSNIYYN
jgi:hypothetical protein